MIIYISNLGSTTKDEDLKKYFAGYGTVSSAKIALDEFSKESRGFGFVEMPDEKAARTAISTLDGTMIEGRSVKVAEAETHNGYNSKSFFNRW
jgi:RNA recognition motif-containing protein